MAANATFPSEENKSLPNFEMFDKNKFADTSDHQDDNEIFLFIYKNQNRNCNKVDIFSP